MSEPATVQKQIRTELSSRQIAFNVGQAAAVFDATVFNDSDRFASFQLKLLAAGALTDGRKPWYRLTPSVSSKIPGGDCTRFQIEVFDLPPITQNFQGAIDLTLEVTSRELVNQYDRQSIKLLAEGIQGQPPGLVLVTAVYQVHPGERVAIAAQLHNPTQSPLEVTVRLSGLPNAWFSGGGQQTLLLVSGKPQTLVFKGDIPSPLQAPSRLYPFSLEAMGRFPNVTATGQLHILPAGAISFACEPLERVIPEHLGRWQNPTHGTAEFALQFYNQSNVTPAVQLTVNDLQPKRRRWFWQKKLSPDLSIASTALPTGIAVGALPIELPLGISTVQLQVERQLPWWGWMRLQRVEVTAQVMDTPIPLQDGTQTLRVHLFPVIPLWLQVLGALLVMGLGALTWWLSDPGHRGPVNSVHFNGQGTEVLSGSNDQTVRRWRVQDQHLHTQDRIGDFERAVRVVQYRPINNDYVAVGLENGEIQLMNLLTRQRAQLIPDKDDRVFALVFSHNAQTLYSHAHHDKLYSGHGSGLILQWDITRLQWDIAHFISKQADPQTAYDVRFAIQAMALSGSGYDQLAIGGRFNRLMLLELSKDVSKAAQLSIYNYPSGGSSDYISSLSAAERQPNLVAVGDTQGRLSVWDTEACLTQKGYCDPIAKPWLGHEGSPIQTVALSADGCFLASGGQDGVVKLWSLNGEGARRSDATGQVLDRRSQPINTVDIVQVGDAVWVVAGGDDGQVRPYKVRLAGDDKASDRCPSLAGGGS